MCRFVIGLDFCCSSLFCGLSLGFRAAWDYASLSVFGSAVDIMDVHSDVKCVCYCVRCDVFPALHVHSSFFDFSYHVAGYYFRQGDVCL